MRVAPNCSNLPPRPKCNCHVCTTNACKMRQMEPRGFHRSGVHLLAVRHFPGAGPLM